MARLASRHPHKADRKWDENALLAYALWLAVSTAEIRRSLMRENSENITALTRRICFVGLLSSSMECCASCQDQLFSSFAQVFSPSREQIAINCIRGKKVERGFGFVYKKARPINVQDAERI